GRDPEQIHEDPGPLVRLEGDLGGELTSPRDRDPVPDRARLLRRDVAPLLKRERDRHRLVDGPLRRVRPRPRERGLGEAGPLQGFQVRLVRGQVTEMVLDDLDLFATADGEDEGGGEPPQGATTVRAAGWRRSQGGLDRMSVRRYARTRRLE